MKNSSKPEDLFRSYLDGTIAPEALARLFKHFGTTDDHTLRKLIRDELAYEEDAHIAGRNAYQERLDAIYRATELRIRNNSNSSKSGRLSIQLRRLAAAAVLIAGGIWIALQHNNGIESLPTNLLVKATVNYRLVELPEGSRIWLAPHSEVSYAREFSSRQRLVKLTGEAFFDVTRDEKRPFFVHSGAVTTRVLGTSFNIQAYEKEPAVSVTVLTGQVSVVAGSRPSSEVTLTPYKQASYHVRDGSLAVSDYPDAEKLLNRRNGHFRYDGEPVPEVVGDMRHIYPFPILLTGDMAETLFYGEKKPDDDVPGFLQDVCRVNNLTFKMRNDTILIGGRNYSQ